MTVKPRPSKKSARKPADQEVGGPQGGLHGRHRAFRFHAFHAYMHLPENHKEFRLAVGRLPEQVFRSRAKGHELYQRYIAELVLADELGFDALVVNEHHNTAYSMMPAPNLIAAALIPQIKNAKICVWGTPPNLENPNRLAEEYAMLDVMSAAGWRSPSRSAPAWNTGPTGQSGDRARRATANRSTSSCRPGRGRSHHLLRRFLHLSLSQSMAAALSEAASALLHRRHRQSGNDRARGQARLRLRARCSSPRSAQSNSISSCANARPQYGHQMRPEQLPLQRHRLCRREQGEGRRRSGRAHPLFLRGALRTHADVPQSRPVIFRSIS